MQARPDRDRDLPVGGIGLGLGAAGVGLGGRVLEPEDRTVIRGAVAHLPRRDTSPKPLWLAWHGGPLPADRREIWQWYQRRFTVEHAFRFLKQDLGWTAPRLRAPLAADRWSRLLGSALWELWLARAHVADARLPWEPVPPPGHHLSPGWVRRVMPGLLATLGTPARPPQPRGKAPGR